MRKRSALVNHYPRILDILQRRFYTFISVSQIDPRVLAQHMKLPDHRTSVVFQPVPILGNGIAVRTLPSNLLDRLFFRLLLIIGLIE